MKYLTLLFIIILAYSQSISSENDYSKVKGGYVWMNQYVVDYVDGSPDYDTKRVLASYEYDIEGKLLNIYYYSAKVNNTLHNPDEYESERKYDEHGNTISSVMYMDSLPQKMILSEYFDYVNSVDAKIIDIDKLNNSVEIGGKKYMTGVPVPVPDSEMDTDIAYFADLDEIEDVVEVTADSIVAFDNFELTEETKVLKVEGAQYETLPDRDKFIPVTVRAGTDITELQKNIIYPELARKAGIEGTVYISVWINKNGKPWKPKVIMSDSKMLEQAAINAVMNAVWTPAEQNDKPVGMWVTIPISFSLVDNE